MHSRLNCLRIFLSEECVRLKAGVPMALVRGMYQGIVLIPVCYFTLLCVMRHKCVKVAQLKKQDSGKHIHTVAMYFPVGELIPSQCPCIKDRLIYVVVTCVQMLTPLRVGSKRMEYLLFSGPVVMLNL